MATVVISNPGANPIKAFVFSGRDLPLSPRDVTDGAGQADVREYLIQPGGVASIDLGERDHLSVRELVPVPDHDMRPSDGG